MNQIPGSDSVAVVYPATLQNYQSSESQGVSAMMSDIQGYVQACPNSKIVLMGYSQVSSLISIYVLAGKGGMARERRDRIGRKC